MYPDMEAELYREYKQLRKQVKGFWFKVHGKQLLQEMHADTPFKFSEGWFDRFKERHRISFRRRTNTVQK